MNLYTDFDPKVCAWLAELVRTGALPTGEVRCRDIKEVTPDELQGFSQVHFFAGIGGWPHALSLAGWDAPCWTASLPCQPFSSAGKRLGTDDDRHLWPVFRELVAQCRPATIFGEQVASRAGREWLAGVRADLEALGYRVGAADLCAASVGAPHIRQRLFWVADAERSGVWSGGCRQDAGQARGVQDENGERQRIWTNTGAAGNFVGLGDTDRGGLEQGNAEVQSRAGEASVWANSTTIPCGDGKARRIEPGLAPLVDGVPARVVRLRGYGNAIVPQVAATFIRAVSEAMKEYPCKT